jgi:hypothetical protein
LAALFSLHETTQATAHGPMALLRCRSILIDAFAL